MTLPEILEFARTYDPQYFHTDPDAARGSIFGEVVASGIHTMALWRQLDHEISGDIAWICGIAWEDVRWPEPVRGGDLLHAEAECLELRPSRGHPERGIAIYRYDLLNQQSRRVFTCRSVNLVERRAALSGGPVS